mmetsp:Transcript_30819/g.72402  ORF Transcript_30819/g.72402 Transcript_30819/m.72402 type:complete len:184 (+) Transcript_30819:101-652(+)
MLDAPMAPGTFWENWGGCNGSSSCNHPMFGGGIEPWIWHHALGLRPPGAPWPHHVAPPHPTGDGSDGPTGTSRHHFLHRVPHGAVHLAPDAAALRTLGRAAGQVQLPGGVVQMEWTAEWDKIDQTHRLTLSVHTQAPPGYSMALFLPPRLEDRSALSKVEGQTDASQPVQLVRGKQVVYALYL